MISKTSLRKKIEEFNKLNKNQVNPNRYFSGYEDALRWVLRELQKTN
ncbi:hypothetical protein [Nitrososphaeria virus YSH_1032793]|uniref:Uncharacterized protein n=1 Tax=Nitrososphaeria virus YSH_1032793 TaxID=3071320 RepID=A0A976UA99_9CAUD|nr:hypothetical protein QKV91_gp01 [Yangshan Harbor Nitrososphaeria virus]UVF62205.1 hypothetical protein [Nitrososphaeria virus YSH_1032793]